MRAPRLLAVALALAVLASPASAAAEPAGAPYPFAAGAPSAFSLASAGQGQVLAHWVDGEGAFARLLGTTGPLDSRLTLPRNRWGASGALAANPRLRQHLRVWSQAPENEGYGAAIVAQVLSGGGAPVGGEITLASPLPSYGQWNPAAVYNPRARQYLVTWMHGDDGPPPTMAGVLLGEDGQPVSEPFEVVSGRIGTPTAAVRPLDGSYLVSWHDHGDGGEETTIRARLLDIAGRRVGEPFLVSAHRNLVGRRQNVDPQIAIDPESNAGLVVWSDLYEVFARRILPSGRPSGRDLWLSRMGPPSDPAWLTRSPDVAYNASARQYLLTWQSGPGRDEYPIGEQVYGQHLDRGANQVGANDFVISPADRSTGPVATAVLGTSDFLVTWSAPGEALARRVTPTTQGRPPTLPEEDPTPDRPPLVQPTVPPPTSPRAASGPSVVAAPAPNAPSGGPAPPAGAAAPLPAQRVAGRQRSSRLRVLGDRRLRTFARRGLRVRVTCPARCRATVRVTVSRRSARRLRSPRTLVRGSRRTSRAGAFTLTLRPRERTVARLLRVARLDMTVRLGLVEADGTVRRVTRRVTLLR